MQHDITFKFNEAATPVGPSKGLTLAIRTDARHATAGLKNNLKAWLAEHSVSETEGTEAHIETIVHGAYRTWGHEVLEVLADCLDYKRYGLTKPEDQVVTVNFYNAKNLAQVAIDKSADLLSADDVAKGLPLVRISLDDMIDEEMDNWGEVGFSRLFNLQGDQQGEYLARPGKKPLVDQIKDVANMLAELKAKHGADIPFVLLEDNVRHAKMLNWVIDLLEKNHVFEHGKLVGISTCFCCASDEEKAKIKHDGKAVPVQAVVNYGNTLVDVVTPRDLLFDGFVVQVGGKTTRLPGIFMNVEKVFKIDPARAAEFAERTKEANVRFCEDIQRELGVQLPMSWFIGADAISEVTGVEPDQPMARALRKNYLPPPIFPFPQAFGT